MTPQDATLAPAEPGVRQPHCPRCGEMLLAPFEAAHVRGSLVRNSWSCEGCGYEFDTQVDFAARRRKAFAYS